MLRFSWDTEMDKITFVGDCNVGGESDCSDCSPRNIVQTKDKGY